MILLPTDTEPDQEVLDSIKLKTPLKFVSFDNHDEGITSIFPHRFEHYGFIENIRSQVEGLKFLGAGIIEPLRVLRNEPEEVKWSSPTCVKKYGYDRPDIKAIEQILEEEIRTTIKRVMEEITTSSRS